MKTVEQRNGVKSFLINPRAIKPPGEIYFRANIDAGAQYIASLPENIFRLGPVISGSVLSVTVANKGGESVVRLIPEDDGQICYGGQSAKGHPLVCFSARSGDYIKLATMDGSRM